LYGDKLITHGVQSRRAITIQALHAIWPWLNPDGAGPRRVLTVIGVLHGIKAQPERAVQADPVKRCR
jgi:hypothetical protein